MCGIVGSVATTPVNLDIYNALTMLQHRGQDAAGMMTAAGNRIYLRKGNGLVRDVLKRHHLVGMQGQMGIGHVRYPTAGSDSPEEAQPLYVNAPYGLCIVHNGNLVNHAVLREKLMRFERRHLNTESDSEVLLNLFASELSRRLTLKKSEGPLSSEDVFHVVKAVQKRCIGAYSVVIMIIGHGLVAFRDPHGIRPLIWGERKRGQGCDYMVASENVALEALGYTVVDDVQPGEALYITTEGAVHRRVCAEYTVHCPCIFEYVYLARPDSCIDHIPVHQARQKMGEELAKKILSEWKDLGIDLVIPVPETSRMAALPLAEHLKVPYREGFIKNAYVGRTFIMPDQALRERSVKQKLSVIASEFKDRTVLLVDDSIVRGTTCQQVIQLVRKAGAKKVYFASLAPKITYPNIYGIDMPIAKELIAHEKSTEQILAHIKADRLIFQDLSGLYAALRAYNPSIKRFEDSVFTGDYVTGQPSAACFEHLAKQRNNTAKRKGKNGAEAGAVV